LGGGLLLLVEREIKDLVFGERGLDVLEFVLDFRIVKNGLDDQIRVSVPVAIPII